MPERRGAFGVEGLCVSVFWGRCVGLLLSCCLLVDCAGVLWSFGRCFDMTHAAFRCCVFCVYECSDVHLCGAFSDCRCRMWACQATPKATCPWTNQVWMPCSGYGPLRDAVLPGARPGLARIPWAGAVVTAQDTVHTSSSRPGGVATRLVRRIGGLAVHGDSEQHAGYGCHHLRWEKAQEGHGKRRDGSRGANGNGTIAICAAKCGSSDPRGATGVQ